MNRKRKLKNNIINIQLYYFFRSFIFAYVIERLFWRSRGISIAETVYIEIIYAAVIILMEVPTGMLADRFTRKHIILAGSLLTFIGSVWLLSAYGFIEFALIIVLAGISGALTSGSNSAILYDSLKEIGEESTFEKYLARIKALRYGSGLIAALIGSFVASRFGLLIPYQMSVFSCLMMVVLNLLLVEPKKGESEDHLSLKEIFRDAKNVLLKNNFLKYVMVTGATIGGIVIYVDEFWQNYMDAISVPVVFFGLISGAMSIVVLIASGRVTSILEYIRKDSLKKKRMYNTLLSVSVMCFIGLFIVRHPLGLLLILVPIYSEALLDTLILGDIHHAVESEFRATMESIHSMMASMASVLFGLVFAFGSEQMGIFGGFLSVGILGGIIVIIKSIYFRQSKRDS